MSTLSEIEKAADALSLEQKQELLLFLATRLRAAGSRIPEPRAYTKEQIGSWIAEDEADMKQFNSEGKCESSSTQAFCLRPVGGRSIVAPTRQTKQLREINHLR